jgi:hypothetical protein
LNKDARSTFVLALQQHSGLVAGPAKDFEDFHCSRVLERHLSLNYNRLAFGEGSDGGTSGGIAVISFQAGLLGSRGPRVDKLDAHWDDCEKCEQCDGS